MIADLEVLVPREMEAFAYACRGYQAKEAAGLMGISYKTVELYSQKINEKLGTSNIGHAVIMANQLLWINDIASKHPEIDYHGDIKEIIGNHEMAPLIGRLSPRGAEVLQLVVRGYSNKNAARYLGISYRTVEVYADAIHKCFGVHRVIHAILLYYLLNGPVEENGIPFFPRLKEAIESHSRLN